MILMMILIIFTILTTNDFVNLTYSYFNFYQYNFVYMELILFLIILCVRMYENPTSDFSPPSSSCEMVQSFDGLL